VRILLTHCRYMVKVLLRHCRYMVRVLLRHCSCYSDTSGVTRSLTMVNQNPGDENEGNSHFPKLLLL
jgi:hypothetical protein